MPEAPEVDTDHLREEIDNALEQEGGRLLKIIALTTACLAVLAALGSLRAGATVNEALALKNDAAQLQIRASDQWAYYQAKGIKAAVANVTGAVWSAAGKTPPADVAASVAKYTAQQDSIAHVARDLEHERDERTVEADHLLHTHHHFANAVALLQVAIALGAIAALTRSKPVYVGSLLVGIAGTIIFAWWSAM